MRKLMAAWMAAALIAPGVAMAQRGPEGPGAEARGLRPEGGPGFRGDRFGPRPDAPRPEGPRPEGPRPDGQRFDAPRPDAGPRPDFRRGPGGDGRGPDAPRRWDGGDRPAPPPPGAGPRPDDGRRWNDRWDRGPNRPDAPPPPPLAAGRPDGDRWAGRRDGGPGLWAGRRDGWDQRRDRDWDRAREDRRFYDRGWVNRGWQDRGWQDRGRWDRGWHGQSRFDWLRYREVNRAAFRLPRYYAPYDWTWGYRRFDIGASLSSGLWARNYWISDPYAYRLPEVYGPYRWVRYYDDALLIDLETGEVVDAVYGIFW